MAEGPGYWPSAFAVFGSGRWSGLAVKSPGSWSAEVEWRCHRQGPISRYTVVRLRYRSVIKSQARAVRVGGGRREVGSRSFQIQIGGEGGGWG